MTICKPATASKAPEEIKGSRSSNGKKTPCLSFIGLPGATGPEGDLVPDRGTSPRVKIRFRDPGV